MALLVKTLNGLAYASVKTRNGLAVASIKSINGVDATGVTPIDPKTTALNWYDATVLGLANNAAVTSFTDSAVGSPNTMGGTAVYKTAIINGLGVVQFNGTSHVFFTNGSSATAGAYTMMGVVYFDDITTSHTIFGVTAGGGMALRSNATTGTLSITKNGTGVIATSTGTVTAGVWYIFTVTYDGANYAFRINRAAAGSGTNAVALSGVSTFRLGADTSGGSAANYHKGYWAECGLWTSVLSSGTIDSHELWLANKFAL